MSDATPRQMATISRMTRALGAPDCQQSMSKAEAGRMIQQLVLQLRLRRSVKRAEVHHPQLGRR